MMCYNKPRDVQTNIAVENTPAGQAKRLDGIIRNGGIAGGMKGYFNAYLSGKKLHVLAHKPLPMQPW